MRISLLLASLIGSSLALPQAGKAKVKSSTERLVDSLNYRIYKVDRAVKGWHGEQQGLAMIFSEAKSLVKELHDGTTTFNSRVPQAKSEEWMEPALRLDQYLANLIDSLVAHKTRFRDARRENDVANFLIQLKPASRNLIKAVYAKLPTYAQSLSKPVLSNLTKRIDKAIKTFQNKPVVKITPKPTVPSSKPGSQPLPASKPNTPAPKYIPPPTTAPQYIPPPTTAPQYVPPPTTGGNQPQYVPPPTTGGNQPQYVPPPTTGGNQPQYVPPPTTGGQPPQYVPPPTTGGQQPPNNAAPLYGPIPVAPISQSQPQLNNLPPPTNNWYSPAPITSF